MEMRGVKITICVLLITVLLFAAGCQTATQTATSAVTKPERTTAPATAEQTTTVPEQTAAPANSVTASSNADKNESSAPEAHEMIFAIQGIDFTKEEERKDGWYFRFYSDHSTMIYLEVKDSEYSAGHCTYSENEGLTLTVDDKPVDIKRENGSIEFKAAAELAPGMSFTRKYVVEEDKLKAALMTVPEEETSTPEMVFVIQGIDFTKEEERKDGWYFRFYSDHSTRIYLEVKDSEYSAGHWTYSESEGLILTVDDKPVEIIRENGSIEFKAAAELAPGMSFTRKYVVAEEELKVALTSDAVKADMVQTTASQSTEAEPSETIKLAWFFAGHTDPETPSVGQCDATLSLYENGTYDSAMITKYGSAPFSKGTWEKAGDTFTFTDNNGSTFTSYTNENGKQEVSGEWDIGSLKGVKIVAEESVPVQKEEETTTDKEAEAKPIELTSPVSITGGQIAGALTEDHIIAAYKGIPYAAAPIKELRWKAPQPVIPWNGVLECASFKANPITYYASQRSEFDQEFGVDMALPFTEDCLFLNVWTKAEPSEAARPVIFFIPGGGFLTGGASCSVYDGEALARKDVVFVSINYRLGAIGFLAHPDLSAESGYNGSGNYGMMDVIAALKWVKDNIAVFGGDPENVTVIGQSAGSRMVHALAASPEAAGLFQRTFTASGHVMDKDFYDLASGEALGATQFAGLSLDEMRAMDPNDVTKQYGRAANITIDGKYLTELVKDAYLNGKVNSGEMIMGIVNGDLEQINLQTKDAFEAYVKEKYPAYAEQLLLVYAADDVSVAEVSAAFMEDAELMLLETQARVWKKATGKEAYIYYITHPYPAKDPSDICSHTHDLAYWFNHLSKPRDPYLTEYDRSLAELMSDLLVQYAMDGKPGNTWLTAEGNSYLRIGDEVKMAEIPADRAVVWKSLYDQEFGITDN